MLHSSLEMKKKKLLLLKPVFITACIFCSNLLTKLNLSVCGNGTVVPSNIKLAQLCHSACHFCCKLTLNQYLVSKMAVVSFCPKVISIHLSVSTVNEFSFCQPITTHIRHAGRYKQVDSCKLLLEPLTSICVHKRTVLSSCKSS